jgi:hypothetical protein
LQTKKLLNITKIYVAFNLHLNVTDRKFEIFDQTFFLIVKTTKKNFLEIFLNGFFKLSQKISPNFFNTDKQF